MLSFYNKEQDKMSTVTISMQHCTGDSSLCNKIRKKKAIILDRNKTVFFFIDYIIVYVANLVKSAKS